MRSVATLLMLLLALPGLVLPAGFLLRICRCDRVTASPDAAATPGCCGAQQKAQASLPRPCCQHSCCRTSDRSDDGAVQVAPVCCKCVFVKVPEHQPEPSLPQHASSTDVLALPTSTVAAIPALGDPGRALRRFAVTHPPPRNHHRNLPLRL